MNEDGQALANQNSEVESLDQLKAMNSLVASGAQCT